jgi:UDP-3-O-[3-hydroxymyristoyl] N-acetylglucosamine deacetylase/3-hydroxyacyl-[acyl-carrier-protein] dehydratase
MPNQQTIKSAATISGVGLHTGQEVTLTFKPADADHGYKFCRVDLEDNPIVNADVDNVVDVSRGTTLEQNGVKVSTIEHVLAALVGLEIDNVLIEIDGPEIPIMDGSAKLFIDALLEAGIADQQIERKYVRLPEIVSYADPENGVEITALPAEEYAVTVMIDYNSKVLGSQHASFDHISEFQEQIGSSRTFVFLHELEALVEGNLIKGGDLNNAIVVVDRAVKEDELSRLAEMFDRAEIKVQDEGILNNVELRYQNEPARHKLLDVVGDLALIGTPVKAKVIATRPGHKANIEFAKKVKRAIKKSQNGQVPHYDASQPSIIDINKINKLLPHKYPFLLVDKIIELEESRVVGVKNVTFNEPFFVGHFPGNPIMPGVLQVEALAQTGGIMVLNSVPDPENYETYFLKIDNTRFKQKVIPGDTLILSMEMMSPIKRGICAMRGTVHVGDKLVTEADLVAQIVKRPDA